MSWDMKHTDNFLSHLSEKSVGQLEALWQRDYIGELTEVQLKYLLNKYELDEDDYDLYWADKTEGQTKAVRMTMIKVIAVIIIGYFVLNAIL